MSHREALPAGTVLDRRFRVDEVLGSGGFGITYLAFDLGLQASVAIKEYFPAQFATREVSLSVSVRSHDRAIFDRLRSSFLREAQTLAQLDHPGIVRVYSVFETNGTAYMVMRFERGKSMKLWLEELGRPPSQAELDRLLEALLSALHHLHGLSFLHRDIAPDNIIIRPDMTPVLVDFGASRRHAGELTATVTGVVKEGYSPQEQYSVNSKAQGPWSDIYSLAATLYRAVSGRKPDEATARMLADTTEPLVQLAEPGYRSTFLAAIDKAMSLHPIDRPQSVDEWAAALLERVSAEPQSVLSETLTAFPGGTAHAPERAVTRPARGRGGKVAAAAVIAALLIMPAAIAYRPAVVGEMANLWQSVTQAQQVAERNAVLPPHIDPAGQPQDSVRAAREQEEVRARAEEARAREQAEARARTDREAREREVAARTQEAATRAKAEEVIVAQKLRDAQEREKAESEARAREAAERERRAKAELEDRERLEAARAKAEAERREALEAEAQRLREAEERRVEQARVEAARRNAERQAEERRRIEEELVAARARIAAQAEALRKAEEAARTARLAAEKAKSEEKRAETKVASLPKATPERSAGNFDGRWTLTRVGDNCFAGRVRSFSFRIDGQKTTNGRGKITNTGGFVYTGQSRRSGRPMYFSGKVTGRKGRGTFYTAGGRCAGTFTVSRE